MYMNGIIYTFPLIVAVHLTKRVQDEFIHIKTFPCVKIQMLAFEPAHAEHHKVITSQGSK